MSSFFSGKLNVHFLFSILAMTMSSGSAEAYAGAEGRGGGGFNYGLGLCYEGVIPGILAKPSNDMQADYVASNAGVVRMAFGDTWLRRTGKILELCGVMFRGDVGQGIQAKVSAGAAPSSSIISERIADFLERSVELDARKRTGVFNFSSAIQGRQGKSRNSDRMNLDGGKVAGRAIDGSSAADRELKQDWGVDFTDMVGLLGPKVSIGSGSVLDGDVAVDVAKMIKTHSVKAAVVSASFGSCALSIRNEEIKAGLSSKLPDVFLLYPSRGEGLASAASAWRSELIRQRGFLMELIKIMALSPGITKQLRDAVDSVALGRFVVFDGGRVDGCSGLDGLESWRASFRFDSEISKKTALEVSEKVKTCSVSSLNKGWSLLKPPSEDEIRSHVVEEEALAADKMAGIGVNTLDAKAYLNTSSSTNLGTNFEDFKNKLAQLFFQWASGKYGTGTSAVKDAKPVKGKSQEGDLIGDLKGKLKGSNFFGSFFGGKGEKNLGDGRSYASEPSKGDSASYDGGPGLKLSFPNDDYKGLFLADWAPPKWPCPSVAVGGSHAWESLVDRSAEAVFCPGTDIAVGKMNVSGGGFESANVAGQKAKENGDGTNDLSVSVLDLVSTSLDRLKVASEMYASFSLAVLKDDVAAGSYKMRSSPSFSCIGDLSETSAYVVRQKIENVRDVAKVDKEVVYAGFERIFKEMDSYLFTVFQSEQDRLFFYASKMREAMLRDDTYRQLDRVRRRENFSSEAK
jgi:hypothetical protein